MKIGIDARFYQEAGPGRYAKNIVEHLEIVDEKNTYFIFLRETGFNLYTPKNPNFKKVLAPYKWYSFEEQTKFLIKILGYKLDLFYIPHFNIPVLYPGKIITAIPDIIMHTFSTEAGTTLPLFYFRFKKLVYYLVVLWAIVRSYKVIVPSQDVLNDFIKYYPRIKKDKYVLAYEGVDPVYERKDLANTVEILTKYGIREPYLLYVSSMYDHKNVLNLIHAFKILIVAHGYKGSLILVGKNDLFSKKYYEEVVKEGLQDRILFPGMKAYVTDAEVVALRSKADLYVFPSLKEGFSLTPLEAMVVGLPCVISKIPCHEEIYGDSVVYFDPTDSNDIAQKVDLVLKNQSVREEIVNKGYEVVKKYSWLKTAETTLRVFKEALNNG